MHSQWVEVSRWQLEVSRQWVEAFEDKVTALHPLGGACTAKSCRCEGAGWRSQACWLEVHSRWVEMPRCTGWKLESTRCRLVMYSQWVEVSRWQLEVLRCWVEVSRVLGGILRVASTGS